MGLRRESERKRGRGFCSRGHAPPHENTAMRDTPQVYSNGSLRPPLIYRHDLNPCILIGPSLACQASIPCLASGTWVPQWCSHGQINSLVSDSFFFRESFARFGSDRAAIDQRDCLAPVVITFRCRHALVIDLQVERIFQK